MREEPGQSADGADANTVEDRGVSRRSVIKRGAIAGGAVLWATPVVQSLGSASAYAWQHGSEPRPPPDGKCACFESIKGIVAVGCRPDMSGADLAPSGKTVVFVMQQVSLCGACATLDETHEIKVSSAHGAELVPRADTTSRRFEVHVSEHPARIKLRVKSVLTCVAEHGREHRCEDDKVVSVCFSRVTGPAERRCGSVQIDQELTHLGTQPCG